MKEGIRERQGFVVLTGEVGIGKTTLLRRLMGELKEEKVRDAYFYNTSLSFDELLVFVCEDFGLRVRETSRVETIKALNHFLIERLESDEIAVLYIDEAQNLAPEVLEELRLLSNLETEKQKLLQIVLVGQPELEEKLDRPDLRQVKQRISVRAQLRRLTESEVGDYVNCRLLAAGWRGGELFTPEAVQWIAHYSEGLPRLINRLCEDSLLLASQFRQQAVPVEIVKQVAVDLRLETGQRKPTFELRKLLGEATAREYRRIERQRKLTRTVGLAALLFAGIAGTIYILHPAEFHSRLSQERDRLARLIEVLRASPASFDDSRPAPASPEEQPGPEGLATAADGPGKTDDPAKGTGSARTGSRDEALGSSPADTSSATRIDAALAAAGDRGPEESATSLSETSTPDLDSPEARTPSSIATGPQADASTESRRSPEIAETDAVAPTEGAFTPDSGNAPAPPDIPSEKPLAGSAPLVKTSEYVLVLQGDSVSQIVGQAYGPFSDLALDLVHRFNPNMGDLNLVRTGQRFYLPVLDRNTLLEENPDGSFRLIVQAFRNAQAAEGLARQWREYGYRTRIVPRKVANGLSLHRVEIVELTTRQEVEDAWRMLRRETLGPSNDKQVRENSGQDIDGGPAPETGQKILVETGFRTRSVKGTFGSDRE